MDPTSGKRNYAAFHNLDAAKILAATVVWNGTDWKVTIDGDIMDDCCDTIEQAYTVAEAEILRRFPAHKCETCRLWHPADEHS